MRQTAAWQAVWQRGRAYNVHTQHDAVPGATRCFGHVKGDSEAPRYKWAAATPARPCQGPNRCAHHVSSALLRVFAASDSPILAFVTRTEQHSSKELVYLT